jgi:hypothetical protein
LICVNNRPSPGRRRKVTPARQKDHARGISLPGDVYTGVDGDQPPRGLSMIRLFRGRGDSSAAQCRNRDLPDQRHRTQIMPTPKQPEPAESPDIEVQQSNVRSPAKQEQLKRLIKQHPQREIPLVESIEPAEAPPKE